MSTGTDIWLTPAWIIDALGGPDSFDLDPCAQDEMPWPTAKHRYTHALNGLMLPWFGRVWLNPPYSMPSIRAFMERMVMHGTGTALVFAKTETRVFFDCIWERASALLFVKGRVRFHTPDGKTPNSDGGSGSVLVAYGHTDADILSALPIDGAFVPLRFDSFWQIATCGTWADELERFFAGRKDPVRLSELYAFFASHPKSGRNPHYQEKIRQVLQRGQFKRVGPGLWARCPV